MIPMKEPVRFKPLVECGSPVTVEFRDKLVQAYSDVNSGYVYFEPPPAHEWFERRKEPAVSGRSTGLPHLNRLPGQAA